ncbi:MAG: nodulation protein NfeD [Thermoanaerobaculia bacterium]|nr:nodulation protein NfeD [Thermoanaerobaculia bacterium]
MRLIVSLGLLLLLGLPAYGAGTEAVVVDIDTDINPVTAEFVKRVIEEAGTAGSPVVVLRINTPGGRLDSTREITKTILASEVPVVGFVHPPGSQAASAGFILLMACDVAAMAPGTNTGAAAPVGGGGEDLPKTIGKKVTEDASALVRSLVVPRGRPVDDAVKTISEALSYSDGEAMEKKLVEIVAKDVPDLFAQLDGRPIKRVGKPDVTLPSKSFTFRAERKTGLEKALGVIASPMVAGLLFLIGVVGLYSEFQNPGAILPGVLGSICLLLAFFAMSVLPTNWVGIGLILLGVLFFFLEVKLTTHGILAIAGGVSIILGAVLLFHRDEFAPRAELWFVVGGAAVTTAILAGLSLMALSVQRLPGRTGVAVLVGQVVPVRAGATGALKVFADGALWEARSAVPLNDGQLVEITGVDGLAVLVKPSARSEKA